MQHFGCASPTNAFRIKLQVGDAIALAIRGSAPIFVSGVLLSAIQGHIYSIMSASVALDLDLGPRNRKHRWSAARFSTSRVWPTTVTEAAPGAAIMCAV